MVEHLCSGVCVCVCSQVLNLRCRILPSTLFETRFFFFIFIYFFAAPILNWQIVSYQGFCLHLSTGYRSTKITDCFLAQLYLGPGDLNSGPHTCVVRTLPTEPFPQPYCFLRSDLFKFQILGIIHSLFNLFPSIDVF